MPHSWSTQFYSFSHPSVFFCFYKPGLQWGWSLSQLSQSKRKHTCWTGQCTHSESQTVIHRHRKSTKSPLSKVPASQWIWTQDLWSELNWLTQLIIFSIIWVADVGPHSVSQNAPFSHLQLMFTLGSHIQQGQVTRLHDVTWSDSWLLFALLHTGPKRNPNQASENKGTKFFLPHHSLWLEQDKFVQVCRYFTTAVKLLQVPKLIKRNKRQSSPFYLTVSRTHCPAAHMDLDRDRRDKSEQMGSIHHYVVGLLLHGWISTVGAPALFHAAVWMGQSIRLSHHLKLDQKTSSGPALI